MKKLLSDYDCSVKLSYKDKIKKLNDQVSALQDIKFDHYIGNFYVKRGTKRNLFGMRKAVECFIPNGYLIHSKTGRMLLFGILITETGMIYMKGQRYSDQIKREFTPVSKRKWAKESAKLMMKYEET